MKKVLINYKFLPQYRVDFYHLLRAELLRYDVELQLIYGQSNKQDALRNDETKIEWAQFIPNSRFYIGKTELLWQPCLEQIKGKDLIIVQSENRLILNYWLVVSRCFLKRRLAFWGHVYNMQDNVDSRRNKIKLKLLHYCDWWFAYTNNVKSFLIESGYPANRITGVQNAIDTRALKTYYAQIGDEEINKLKTELGITGSNVAIHCGGMYPGKNFDFILQTCFLVKKAIPDFHMLFVGAGVESDKINKAAANADWIHNIGPKFGNDRVIYFRIASVQLMPVLVGLCVLDSFAMETPLITTDHPFHSPEIDYLENGKNGIMTKFDQHEYAQTIIDILKERKYIDLIEAGKASAEKYDLQNMVENFKNGILLCLNYENLK
jgi:glycosyltransferase involved in cell wall biosynthesis